jgi:KWG Leptospira.
MKSKSAFTFTPINGEYDYIGEFREGLAFVRNNYDEFRAGYIDKTGKIAVPLDYYGRFGKETFVHYNHFCEGLAPLIDGRGRFGYVNKIGETVIPFEYDFTYTFSGGLAAVKKDGKWGFVDRSGNVAIPLKYDSVGPGIFHEGRIAVKQSGGWGYIDKTGAELTPFIFETANSSDHDEAHAEVNLASHQTDSDETGSFREGLAVVKKDGKYGYIDKTGAVVLPVIYDRATSFSEGHAAVKKDGAWTVLSIADAE